jgi:hypothetical protein
MIVASLERICTLVTDDGAADSDLAPFRGAGIKIIIAKLAAAEPRQELA